jgi:hypothetical protein
MASDAGLNTEEVQEALDNASSEEERRYLQRVLDHRGVRLASVSSHEIVAGNPDAYPERTVKQQEDLAKGRPHEPVSPEDTAVRGNEPTPSEEKPAKASGNQQKSSGSKS